MTRHSDALEQQLDLISEWRPGGRCDEMVDVLIERIEFEEGKAPTPEILIRGERQAMERAESYYISPEIFDTVQLAASKLPPSTTISLEQMPSQYGFILFPDTLDLIHDCRNDGGYKCIVPKNTTNIRALCWSSAYIASESGSFLSGDMIVICSYAQYRDDPRLVPNYVMSWNCKDPISNDLLDKSVVMYRPILQRFLSAFVFFVQQKILTAEPTMIERHARKRVLAQGFSAQPVVRIVQLRRRGYRDAGQVNQSAVEWSHQWVVSGHWRQQPYPSKNIVQPKWIMPYVKGPDDRPLKPPRAKVFAVVR